MGVTLSYDSCTITNMLEPVKSRRYDNSRRQAQARATRACVVAAARELFIERGYVATTVEAISEAADTPLATVYRLFVSKRGILQAVLEVAFVGDDEPLALHERPTAHAAASEQDPCRMLAGYARLCREVLDRSAGLHQVLRSAADVDSEAAELLARTNDQRLAGHAMVARGLAERGALAEGMTEDDARDIIYTLMSPGVHRTLNVERHWTADRYEQWLAETLCTLLLPARNSRRVRRS